VLLALSRKFKMNADQGAIFAVALCQVGEFAFVLLSLTEQQGVLAPETARSLVAVTALSMAASPLLLALNERFVMPRLGRAAADERETDIEDEDNPVIIAGYGRFGQIAGRFLRANGVGVTAIDVDSEQLDVLRKFGQKVFYGDASRLDLLRAAGAHKARLLIVAVEEHANTLQIVQTAKAHFPNLELLVRVRGRQEAYEILDLGVDDVYRETFETSIRVGTDAMRLLGAPGHRAVRSARLFRRLDETTLRDLAALRGDQAKLMKTVRERVALLEEAMRADGSGVDSIERGWDSEPLRQASLRSALQAAEKARQEEEAAEEREPAASD
jgi:voltage-gated potassium channel Kch